MPELIIGAIYRCADKDGSIRKLEGVEEKFLHYALPIGRKGTPVRWNSLGPTKRHQVEKSFLEGEIITEDEIDNPKPKKKKARDLIFHNPEWIQEPTASGYTTMRPIADGRVLKPINHPRRYSVVYMYDKDKDLLRPVIILDGNYEAGGRVSNFWYWLEINEDVTVDADRKAGYGNFYVPPFDIDVKVETKYTVTLPEE
jgi:hypothetical protein